MWFSNKWPTVDKIYTTYTSIHTAYSVVAVVVRGLRSGP